MKNTPFLFLLLFVPLITWGQSDKLDRLQAKEKKPSAQERYLVSSHQLTLEAALQLTSRARETASSLNKEVTVAVLDGSGQVLLLTRGAGVGPHNTEAARRKAYTSFSTKTPTLQLARNARSNTDTENLANLPELLLLGGGSPLWYEGEIIGSIGIAGGGGPENDDLIAKSAAIPEAGFLTTQLKTK